MRLVSLRSWSSPQFERSQTSAGCGLAYVITPIVPSGRAATLRVIHPHSISLKRSILSLADSFTGRALSERGGS
jgi:hypothetical protein